MVNKMNKNREIQKRLNRQTDANIDELKLGTNPNIIYDQFMQTKIKNWQINGIKEVDTEYQRKHLRAIL